MSIDGNKIINLLNIKGGKDVGMILKIFKDAFLENPNKFNEMTDNQINVFIKTIYSKIQDNRL